MNTQNETMPIGKYKGRPISVLQNDRGYCDWLLSQDWLQTRYPQLRTIIINNFTEPNETPEHNAMQARFLDHDIVFAVYVALFGVSIYEKYVDKIYMAPIKKEKPKKENLTAKTIFEHKGCDVVIDAHYGEAITIKEQEYPSEYKHRLEYLCNELLRCVSYRDRAETRKEISDAKESGEIKIHWFHEDGKIFVELKPLMGDDYPSILRQILSNTESGHKAAIIGAYTGQGVPFDKVRAMFAASSIRLYLMREIEEIAATIN